MHRLIPYPAQIPLDTDLLNVERWAVQGLGQLAGAAYGFGVVAASGLLVTPGSSGLTVTVAPGSVMGTLATDATAYGSLAADNDMIVQQWLLDTATTVTIPATGTTYYVSVSTVGVDDTPVVLPFYNASNPAQTYAGQGNSGATLPTRRAKVLTVSITTSLPAGNVLLATILVPSGNTTVAAANITNASGSLVAPFYPTIPQLAGRWSNTLVFTSSTTWTPPAGVTLGYLRAWGGGGAGGGVGGANAASSGGSGGGYTEGAFTFVAGVPIPVTVGAGGAAFSGANNGANGGATSFGSYATASGGKGGIASAGGIAASPGSAGTGFGGQFSRNGGAGPIGFTASTAYFGGPGGGAFGCGKGNAAGTQVNGNPGLSPGQGGDGCATVASANISGGAGAAGLIILEF